MNAWVTESDGTTPLIGEVSGIYFQKQKVREKFNPAQLPKVAIINYHF